MYDIRVHFEGGLTEVQTRNSNRKQRGTIINCIKNRMQKYFWSKSELIVVFRGGKQPNIAMKRCIVLNALKCFCCSCLQIWSYVRLER